MSANLPTSARRTRTTNLARLPKMPASDLVAHRIYRVVGAVAGTPHNSRGRFYVECPGGHRGYIAIGTAPRGRPSWCRCVERAEVADAAE